MAFVECSPMFGTRGNRVVEVTSDREEIRRLVRGRHFEDLGRFPARATEGLRPDGGRHPEHDHEAARHDEPVAYGAMSLLQPEARTRGRAEDG